MAFTRKTINIGLSPNTQPDDILQALGLILSFGWINPPKSKNPLSEGQISSLEGYFKGHFGAKYVCSFNAGRSALLAILSSLDLPENSEIIIQAFTCNAVVNPITKMGLRPVYVDIDETLNLEISDLEKKITPLTRAVIVQHTFGLPAKIEKIKEICRQHGIWLIEDCAHALGAKVNGKLCGTFGDAAFFSFGRDKIISSVFGGMALSANDKIGAKLEKFWQAADYPHPLWTLQQLAHPALTRGLVVPFYDIANIGKILAKLFLNLGFISYSVRKEENDGILPDIFPRKLPAALAELALRQIKKLEAFNAHRRLISGIYLRELEDKNFMPILREVKSDWTPLRFSLIVRDAPRFISAMKRKNIYLDDGWNKSPVVPWASDLEKMRYAVGSCPRAEKIAASIVNLPTHINLSQDDARYLAREINKS